MPFARWQKPIQDDRGNLVTTATVEVRREDSGALALLYADRTGDTIKANPFALDPGDDGLAWFYSAGGAFRVRAYGTGFDRTYRYEKNGTAGEQDANAYAQAGWTFAPESATTTPPASGAIRFNNADITLASHIYVSKTTLGGSTVTSILLGLDPGGKTINNRILLAGSDGSEVSFAVESATAGSTYVDLLVSDYQGTAGPQSFGDSGFVTVAREISGTDGDLTGIAYVDAETDRATAREDEIDERVDDLIDFEGADDRLFVWTVADPVTGDAVEAMDVDERGVLRAEAVFWVGDAFHGALECTNPDIIDAETGLDVGGDLRLLRWTDEDGNRNGLHGGADLFSIEHNDPTLIEVHTAFDADGVLRIVSALDCYGDDPTLPLPALEGGEFLRLTAAKIKNILNGTVSQLVINVVGDSYTYNNLWFAGMLRKSLADLIGDAGPGYIDFTNALELSSPTVLSSPSAYSSGYAATLTGAWVQTVYTSPSPPNGEQSTTATAKVTVTGPAAPVLSAVYLHYIKTADGHARYRWNGGSYTSLDLTAGANTGLNQIALSGLPASGTWTLEIEWVSGTVTLGGLDMRSAAAGVRLNKLGKNGAKAQHIAELDATQWEQGQAALEPDLVIIPFGTNDQANRTPAQFAANVRTDAQRARVARPYADILMVVPAENFVTGRVSKMRHMAKAVRYALRDLDVAFLDLQPSFGRRPSEYGVAGRAFFDEGADAYHPTLLGHARITAAILSSINP